MKMYTISQFKKVFVLVLVVFLFLLIHQEHDSKKYAWIEPDTSTKEQHRQYEVIKSTQQVLHKFKVDIKTIGSLTKGRQTRQRVVDSTRYFTKSAEDLAFVKKYPEVPMTFTHRDVYMCGTTTYKILILVFSENENAMLRKTIRRTWGSLDLPGIELRWRVIYIVGRPLEKAGKDQRFFDEVMGNDLLGVHAKNSRTMQALYGALYWAINGCSFEKLLVMQDHMFLNIKALYQGIHKLQMKFIQQVYINSLKAMPKSAQNPTKHTTGYTNKINSMKTYNENAAWLISRDYLTELLPKIRIFMNSDFEGTAVLVDEFMMKHIGVDSRKSRHFFSEDTPCTLQTKIILSLQTNSSCIEKLYKKLIVSE